MAYDAIPKSRKEALSIVSGSKTEIISDVKRLYDHLVKKYPKIEDPLAFDPKKKNECKIRRALQTAFKLGDLKKELKLHLL